MDLSRSFTKGTKYRALKTKIVVFCGRLQRGNGELFGDNLLESFSVYGGFNLTSLWKKGLINNLI